MKNIAKKAAAFALAFTLLGTGTAVTKTFSPTSDTSITASAACYHSAGQPRAEYGEWTATGKKRLIICPVVRYEKQYKRTITYRCSSCGKTLYTVPEYKWQWAI